MQSSSFPSLKEYAPQERLSASVSIASGFLEVEGCGQRSLIGVKRERLQ